MSSDSKAPFEPQDKNFVPEIESTVYPAGDEATQVAAPENGSTDLGHVRSALAGAGVATYEWHLADDRIIWSENAEAVLGLSGEAIFNSGRHFAACVDSVSGPNRYDAVVESRSTDAGSGVPFEIEYALKSAFLSAPEAGARWIEDRGRWFAGADGRPSRVVGVVRVVTDRKEREEKLNYLATYDELTGFFNRSRLRHSLQEIIGRATRYRTPAAYILAAIDNLAMLNEAYGFHVADQVIVEVSRRLQDELRSTDVIGRSSGNKFGMILEHCNDTQMQATVERFLRVIRDQVIDTDAGPVSATVSIGCVALPGGAQSEQDAMARAEEALDEAKTARRDSYATFVPSPEREQTRKRNISIADQVISALNERRLILAYQPIVSTETGEAVYYESLLRMVRTDGEIISAGAFIPLAEQLGLARLIDLRALELAIETLTTYPDANLTLNVSGMTATDGPWLDHLTALVARHPELSSRLMLEITETAAIQEIEDTSHFVGRVRDLGCGVAIDDFGAGYTSFRNLKILDVDMVKIDGSFTKDLQESQDNQMFIRTFVDLARNFNLPTVAEWVRSDADVRLLGEFGVTYLQGFHFGTPMIEAPWKCPDADKEEPDVAEAAIDFV